MKYTDEEIIKLYEERNQYAITATQEKYEHYLMKISKNILWDEEDCKENVNDTYFKTWQAIPPQHPNAFSLFIGKINRQGAIDIYRKKSSKKRGGNELDLCLEELAECLEGRMNVEENIEASFLVKLMEVFVGELPKEKRMVFLGRYYYMDSVKDIAGYCNMSEQNVRNILHRTRIQLKEILKKEGFFIG